MTVRQHTKSWNKAAEAGEKKAEMHEYSLLMLHTRVHTQRRTQTHMDGQAHKAERNSIFSWIQLVVKSMKLIETDSTTLVQFNDI